MQHDEDYWNTLNENWSGEEGYYWFRDHTEAEPEITRMIMKRPDHRFFDNDVQPSVHFRFAFDYAEQNDMELEDILRRYENGAQVSVERIKPPQD